MKMTSETLILVKYKQH